MLEYGASVTRARHDGMTALKFATQDGTPTEIRQAIAANGKVCDFSIFGIALGQPLPEHMDSEIIWVRGLGGKWEMPQPFRWFTEAFLERTEISHRITSILLTCEVGSKLQQREETEAIRKALEQKFDVESQLPAYAVELKSVKDGKAEWRLKEGYEKTPMEAQKDGVTIKIYPNGYMGFSSRHEVSLRIFVTDEEALQLLDGFATPEVESNLDVL